VYLRRPAQVWACYSGGSFIYTSPTNRTDVEDGTVCFLVDDVISATKEAYYAARLLSLLTG
jgi:hypothetical protein